MSTKATIAHGEGFHVYRDALEDMMRDDPAKECVFIDLAIGPGRLEDMVWFEASPDRIKIRIPASAWDSIVAEAVGRVRKISMKLNKSAYAALVAEDRAWLMTMPRTLEREHIAQILDLAVAYEYPPTDHAAAESLARRFHEHYERLAPSHGYETRKESAKPWEDVPEKNRRLMVAVAHAILNETPDPESMA